MYVCCMYVQGTYVCMYKVRTYVYIIRMYSAGSIHYIYCINTAAQTWLLGRILSIILGDLVTEPPLLSTLDAIFEDVGNSGYYVCTQSD